MYRQYAVDFYSDASRAAAAVSFSISVFSASDFNLLSQNLSVWHFCSHFLLTVSKEYSTNKQTVFRCIESIFSLLYYLKFPFIFIKFSVS